jgi:hypothetical protein
MIIIKILIIHLNLVFKQWRGGICNWKWWNKKKKMDLIHKNIHGLEAEHLKDIVLNIEQKQIFRKMKKI